MICMASHRGRLDAPSFCLPCRRPVEDLVWISPRIQARHEASFAQLPFAVAQMSSLPRTGLDASLHEIEVCFQSDLVRWGQYFCSFCASRATATWRREYGNYGDYGKRVCRYKLAIDRGLTICICFDDHMASMIFISSQFDPVVRNGWTSCSFSCTKYITFIYLVSRSLTI